MTWVPDDRRLLDILGLVRQSREPGNQSRLVEELQAMKAVQENCLYLCYLFAQSHEVEVELRQVAGILVKNWIPTLTDARVIHCLREIVINGITDGNEVIRSTSGNLITATLQQGGCDSWPQVLDTLAHIVTNSQDASITLSALETYKKIAEDELDNYDKIIYAEAPELNREGSFAKFSVESLLPMLLTEAENPNTPFMFASKIMDILCAYSRGGCFAEGEFAECFCDRFWHVTARYSRYQESIMKLLVTQAICDFLETNLMYITGSDKAVYEYMVKCCDDPCYDVKANAFLFWNQLLQQDHQTEDLVGLIKPLLQSCLRNMVYSSHDFEDMDESQLAGDNANEVDQSHRLQPRTFARRVVRDDDDEEDEEDNHESERAWGNSWTLRKSAGLTLDLLAMIYKDDILVVVIPIIQRKLENATNWLEVESGILALGAISRGCQQGLAEYADSLIEFMITHAGNERPIVRSISIWCISRYASWICRAGESKQLERVLIVFIALLKDRNKTVQDAACSSLASFLEDSYNEIIPYIPSLFDCFVHCLGIYQTTALTRLYSCIGEFANFLGSDFCQTVPNLNVTENLLLVLVNNFNQVDPMAYELPPLIECLSSIIRACGHTLPSFPNYLLDRCDTFIVAHMNEILSAEQGGGASKPASTDVLECVFDLISSILLVYGSAYAEKMKKSQIITCLQYSLGFCGSSRYKNLLYSAVLLVGDLTSYTPDLLVPIFPLVVQRVCECLHNSNSVTRCNAAWCLSQVILHSDISRIGEFLPHICHELSAVLQRSEGSLEVNRNVSVALGYLASRCPDSVATYLPKIAERWIDSLNLHPMQSEDYIALLGLIQAHSVNSNVLSRDGARLRSLLHIYLNTARTSDVEQDIIAQLKLADEFLSNKVSEL